MTPNFADSDAPVTRVARLADRRRRRGVVLLFVVVLLTLLAVIGSAFLISTRVNAGNLGAEARGQEVDTFGRDAEQGVEEARAAVVRAAQLALFLDLFESERPAPTNGTAERDWPAGQLAWRPTRTQAQTIFQAATPAPAYAPMAEYGNEANTTAFPGGLFVATPADDTTTAAIRFPFYNVDAVGNTDPHLASRVPSFDAVLNGGDYAWDWISAPLAGLPGMAIDNVFVDPLLPVAGHSGNVMVANLDANTAAPFARANVVPTPRIPPFGDYDSPYDGFVPGATAQFYNDRVRTYAGVWSPYTEGLVGNTGGTLDPVNEPEEIFTGADADGDGVADSMLVPFVFDTTYTKGQAGRYVDPLTGYAYLYGIRIVDNNSAVNVNTALSRVGDIDLTAAPFDATTEDYEAWFGGTTPLAGPNRGIWTSNIGLYELFPGSTGTAPNEFGETDSVQFQTFVPTLLGNATAATVNVTASADAQRDSGGTPDVWTATLGETLGLSIARRLDSPVTTTVGGETPAPFLSDTVASSLLYRGGGWLVPDADRNRLERATEDALVTAAGNFVPDDELVFDAYAMFDPNADVANTKDRRALWAQAFKGVEDATVDGRYTYDRATLGVGAGTADYPISPRPSLVARNGVSQAFQPLVLSPATVGGPGDRILANAEVPLGMPPYAWDGTDPIADVRPPVKAGLNTAGFGELWRAFWNVMADTAVDPTTLTDPSTFAVPTGTGVEPFANTNVGPGTMTTEQVLLLRAALAAVNTMDIRDVERITATTPEQPAYGNSDITAAEIDLTAFGDGTNLKARVYGTEAQPFITEVILEWQDDGNGGVELMYAGIELINPYPYALDMSGWKLVAAPGTNPLPFVATLAEFGAGTIFPAATSTGGVLTPHRLVIELGASAALPAPVVVTSGTNVTLASSLTPAPTLGAATDLEGQAMYLVRPTISGSTDPVVTADRNMVPLDMVDVTGLDPEQDGDTADDPDQERWRYARDDADGRSWQYVFHGAYSPAAAAVPDQAATRDFVLLTTSDGQLGEANAPDSTGADLEAGPTTSSSVTATTGFPVGPVLASPVYAPGSTEPTYPYGGFARDGDALSIPIVGSYVLFSDADTDGLADAGDDAEVATMRPVTVDTTLSAADLGEALGRFVAVDAAGTPLYPWAADVIDYVTALYNFGEDTFPNVDLRHAALDLSLDASTTLPIELLASYPSSATALFQGTTTLSGTTFQVPPTDNDGNGLYGLTFPASVAGFTTDVEAMEERLAEAFTPAQGLINLYTSDASILRTVPLDVNATTGLSDGVTPDDDTEGLANTLTIKVDGVRQPYVSSNVPARGLSDFADDLATGGGNAGGRHFAGDITGVLPTATDTTADASFYDSNIAGGYEEAITDLARVSNLLTTRSDSYTVYIVIQAWENFGNRLPDDSGSAEARLVRQQRVAFLVDRSGVYPLGHNIGTELPGNSVDPAAPAYDTIADALEAMEITPIEAN